jgi:hypothetical protein
MQSLLVRYLLLSLDDHRWTLEKPRILPIFLMLIAEHVEKRIRTSLPNEMER